MPYLAALVLAGLAPAFRPAPPTIGSEPFRSIDEIRSFYAVIFHCSQTYDHANELRAWRDHTLPEYTVTCPERGIERSRAQFFDELAKHPPTKATTRILSQKIVKIEGDGEPFYTVTYRERGQSRSGRGPWRAYVSRVQDSWLRDDAGFALNGSAVHFEKGP